MPTSGVAKGLYPTGGAFDLQQQYFFGKSVLGTIRGGDGIGLGPLPDEQGPSMLLVMEVSGAIQASFYINKINI